MKPEFSDHEGVKDLRKMINAKALKFYIEQSDIEKTHPCESKHPLVHPTYEAAVCMVSERHDKYDLVDLVAHILLRLGNSQIENNRLLKKVRRLQGEN